MNNEELTAIPIIPREADLPELTIRQQKMLKSYLKSGNATQAYRDAGYSSTKNPDKVAYNLMHRPPLQTHVEYYLAKAKTKVDKDWITERLEGIVKRTEHEEYDSAIKAIAELNKMQGNYAPIQTDNRSVSITQSIEDVRNARLQYKQDK